MYCDVWQEQNCYPLPEHEWPSEEYWEEFPEGVVESSAKSEDEREPGSSAESEDEQEPGSSAEAETKLQRLSLTDLEESEKEL